MRRCGAKPTALHNFEVEAMFHSGTSCSKMEVILYKNELYVTSLTSRFLPSVNYIYVMPTRDLPLLRSGAPVDDLLEAKLTSGELSGSETHLEVWHSEPSFIEYPKNTFRGLYRWIRVKLKKMPSSVSSFLYYIHSHTGDYLNCLLTLYIFSKHRNPV